jgi:hypothetical protein
MKSCLGVLNLLHVDRQTDGQTNRHGEANRHIFTFLAANMPKKNTDFKI